MSLVICKASVNEWKKIGISKFCQKLLPERNNKTNQHFFELWRLGKAANEALMNTV